MQHYYGLQAQTYNLFLHVGLGMRLPLYYIFFIVFTIGKHAEYRGKGIYRSSYHGTWKFWLNADIECGLPEWHPKWKGKIYIVMNKWKVTTVHMYVQCFSLSLQAFQKTYWSLTPQLGTVVIEVSLVKVPRLRGDPWRLVQGQTFAITKWDLWWHRVLQHANYLGMKIH